MYNCTTVQLYNCTLYKQSIEHCKHFCVNCRLDYSQLKVSYVQYTELFKLFYNIC